MIEVKGRWIMSESNSVEVACFGEPLIGFYGKNKFDAEVLPFEMIIGGDTSNVAMAISKLGHHVSYITRLGDDFFGKHIWKAWKKASVQTDDVIIDKENSTGAYFALFDDNKNHQFCYKRQNSASANYSIKDAKNVSLEGLKVFHLSGISQAISKRALETSFYFMKKCKKQGILISYDLNYRSPLWSKDFFNSVAWQTINKYADIVSLNIEEAGVLGLEGDPEEIVKKILRSGGPDHVILKLGSEGSIMGTKDLIEYCDPFEVEVVDTVGAGDSFTAANIVGIIEGMEIKKRQKFANAVAAIVCSNTGSTSGQPNRHEIDQFVSINEN